MKNPDNHHFQFPYRPQNYGRLHINGIAIDGRLKATNPHKHYWSLRWNQVVDDVAFTTPFMLYILRN